MNNTIIYREILSDAQRINQTAQRFGAAFSMKVEPVIYDMAAMLSVEYQGGYWDIFKLSNQGLYMAPCTEKKFAASSPNGYTGTLSADALGITACLFAFSHLSFDNDALAAICSQHFHWLREYAIDHAEVQAILAATD